MRILDRCGALTGAAYILMVTIRNYVLGTGPGRLAT